MAEAPLDADDRGPSRSGKKKLNDALYALSKNGAANHPRLNDLGLARIINRLHGGGVITAMEVPQLSDEWLDLFLALEYDLPKIQAREKIIKQKFKEFEAAHPTYRRTHH